MNLSACDADRCTTRKIAYAEIADAATGTTARWEIVMSVAMMNPFTVRVVAVNQNCSSRTFGCESDILGHNAQDKRRRQAP